MSGAGRRENQPIQLLRALAALAVALVHLSYGFADHVGQGLAIDHWRAPADQLAQVAVALFFMVSGYVMVRSSEGRFGRAGGTAWFWRRRAVRVLPPYWLATALMLAVLAWLGTLPLGADLAKSLVLWPYWPPEGSMQVLVLWPAWTLFYEAVFYLLFGLGVSRGRDWALGLAMGGLLVLGLIGLVLRPEGALLFALTRPLLWLFVPGMLLALWHGRGGRVPAWLRGLALLGAVPLAMAVPEQAGELGASYVVWAGGPALLLFVGVAGAGADWRVPCYRVIGPLGHASYALYLLHLPVTMAVMALLPGRLFALGPWGILALLIVATLITAFAFWHWVERPMTRWLNARFDP